MSFNRMHSAVTHLLPKVYEHPFNKELCQGTLSKKTFHFYLEQDALYLRDFAQALNKISNRLNIKTHAQQFKKFANETIDFERDLHHRYLNNKDLFGLFSAKRLSLEKIPAIAGYTNHLLEAADFAPIEEAVASCIPCFWLYNELGQRMSKQPSYNKNNPYYDWISSYCLAEYSLATKSIIEIWQELNGKISCSIKEKNMINAFVKSTEYEVLFWDSVYKKADSKDELLFHAAPLCYDN